jgi:hypothetical protein
VRSANHQRENTPVPDRIWELRPGHMINVRSDNDSPGLPAYVHSVLDDGTVEIEIPFDFPLLKVANVPRRQLAKKFPAVPREHISRVHQIGDFVIFTKHEINGRVTEIYLPPEYMDNIGRLGTVVSGGVNDDGIPLTGVAISGEICSWAWAPAQLVHPYDFHDSLAPALAVVPDEFLAAEQEAPDPVAVDMENPPPGTVILAQVGLSILTLVSVLGYVDNGVKRGGVWHDVSTGRAVRDDGPVTLIRVLFLPEMVLSEER